MKMSSRVFRTRGDAHGTAKTPDRMDKQAGVQPLAHEANSGCAPPLDILLYRALKSKPCCFLCIHHLSLHRQGPGPALTSARADTMQKNDEAIKNFL